MANFNNSLRGAYGAAYNSVFGKETRSTSEVFQKVDDQLRSNGSSLAQYTQQLGATPSNDFLNSVGDTAADIFNKTANAAGRILDSGTNAATRLLDGAGGALDVWKYLPVMGAILVGLLIMNADSVGRGASQVIGAGAQFR